MAGFLKIIQYVFYALPEWLTIVIIAVFAIIAVLILLAVVKAVLDAIPFV
nr:MAG TPA: lacticin Q bacteriocin [Inoviridae sp.]